MKFNSSPLLLSVIALLSASGSIADGTEDLNPTATGETPKDTHAPNAVGCADGSCWASCVHEEIDGEAYNMADAGLSWKEGGDWCWLVRGQGPDFKSLPWAECEEALDCSLLFTGYVFCDFNDDNSCSSHQ